jgi:glycosyltransferase involved in cell wall biosynthesis
VSDRRISVIVPTKGRPAWCEEAVRSALAQEGVDVEVVAVLDGEQAETRARLAAIADPRVRVVPVPPSGRSAARNAGIAAATSGLLSFLDDDDRLFPGGLLARREALARHAHAVLVYGRPVTMTAEGVEVPRSRRAAARGKETCEDRLHEQMRGRSIFPSTVLLRREVVVRAGTFDEDLATGEDWLFFLRAATIGPFVFLPEPTVLYRRHAGQVRSDPAAMEEALPVWTARWFGDPRAGALSGRARARLLGRHLAWIARNHRRVGDAGAAARCLRAAVRLDPRLLLHPRRAALWVGAVLAGR